MNTQETKTIKKGCRLFSIAMTEKLQDRLPLKSAIVRYSSLLVLHNMVNYKDLCILKFEKLVEKLYKNSSITFAEVDNSKNEFSNFLILVQQHREKFEEFNKHTQKLDSFLAEFIVPNLGQYKHIWKICFFYLYPLSWAKPSRKRF